jgi:hypothetical protein
MNKQTEQFFEYFDKWQALADKHGVTVYQIVNAREIWDYAYTAGKLDGVTEMYEIATKESN